MDSPAAASAAARLAVTADLPSPEIDDDTTIERGGLSTLEKARLVRSIRRASAVAQPRASLREVLSGMSWRLLLRRESTGTAPSSGRPVRFSTPSEERILRSKA